MPRIASSSAGMFSSAPQMKALIEFLRSPKLSLHPDSGMTRARIRASASAVERGMFTMVGVQNPQKQAEFRRAPGVHRKFGPEPQPEAAAVAGSGRRTRSSAGGI